jgi:hypothetical protein
MSKHDPLAVLRQMRDFCQRAAELGKIIGGFIPIGQPKFANWIKRLAPMPYVRRQALFRGPYAFAQ